MSHEDCTDRFVELMTAHQGRLFAFVLSLLGNRDAANEVLQETNVVLWKQWREFEPGTNFKAWAFRIAHFQTMAYRQRRLRDRLQFDDNLVGRLAIEAKQHNELWQQRSERLAACLERLNPRHRRVLHLRYVEGLSVAEVAERLKRSANAVSQLLFRVRERLIDCVRRAEAT